MSTNDDDIVAVEIPPDTPITLRMLEAYSNVMMAEIKKDNRQLYESVAAEKRDMRQESADLKLQFQHLLNALQGNAQGQQQPQNQGQGQQGGQQHAEPAAATAAARQRFDIGEIAAALRDAATAYKDVKSAYNGEPDSPIDPKLESIYKANMANLFNRGMKVTTNAITKLLNKEINSELSGSGPITKQIASDIVGGASHEPIL